uniref:Endonuclease-reverse transcriptase n=2 Tax=Cacopsylla melanoneura TaxID=428564 RepID=A0A8D8UMV1_9HEMI
MTTITLEALNDLLDSKLSVTNQGVKLLEDKLDQNFKIISEGMSTMKEEIIVMKEEQTKQGKQINQLEMDKRNTNIILHGIKEESYHQSLIKTMEILNGIGIQGSKYLIKDLRKLGKGKWTDCPLLVSLISVPLKIDILKNKNLIKEKFPNVIVKDDLSKEAREKRIQLAEYSKLAHDNNLKVYMKQDKLVVNKKEWTLEELQKDLGHTFLNKYKRPRDEDKSPNKNAKKPQGSISRKNSIEKYLIQTMDIDENGPPIGTQKGLITPARLQTQQTNSGTPK